MRTHSKLLTAPPRRNREDAERVILIYAKRAARALADNEPSGIDQTRRRLAVRLWADIPMHEFAELAEHINTLRLIEADDERTVDDLDIHDDVTKASWLDYHEGFVREFTRLVADSYMWRAA